MRFKKQSLRVLCFVICILLTLPTPAFAAKGTNDYSEHWAGKQIINFLDKGFLNLNSDGSFKPNDPITRADFAAIANKAFYLIEKDQTSFKDMNEKDTYYNDLLIAKKAGYLVGFPNGTVMPKGYMSRQEYAVIISRLLKLDTQGQVNEANKYKDIAVIPDWSKGAIGAVSKLGYMQGEPGGKFNPKGFVTRGEAVAVLERCYLHGMKVVYSKAGTYSNPMVEGNVMIDAPDVTLENTIITGNLIIGKGVGNGDVRLKNVTIKGETIVKGGGLNSIIIQDSQITSIIILKEDNKVRIVAVGTTVVERVDMQSGGKLEEQGTTGKGFNTVTISESVDPNVPIVLLGSFSSVQVQADGVKLEVASGAIEKLDIAPSAGNTQVNLMAGVKVTEMIVGAKSEVTGAGTIGTADVKVMGTVITAPTATVKTAPGVTMVTPPLPPPPPTTTTPPPTTSVPPTPTPTTPIPTPTPTTTPITAIGGINGVPKVGVELTAGALTPANATVSYQWKICDTAGGTYTNISGATANKYTPSAADASKYIKVTATGTGSYSGEVTSAATAQVARIDQAAPTGLAGIAPTAAGNDGRITGTTSAMEYKLSANTQWIPATGTEISGIIAGTYNVRYAAKEGYHASAAADVIVPFSFNSIAMNMNYSRNDLMWINFYPNASGDPTQISLDDITVRVGTQEYTGESGDGEPSNGKFTVKVHEVNPGVYTGIIQVKSANAFENGANVTITGKNKLFGTATGSFVLPVSVLAKAFSSRVIEVSLSESANVVAAGHFTVKNSTGATIETAKAELAGWDATNKTVILTLKTDMIDGETYTLTSASGGTSVSFLGMPIDTTKPTVSSINAVSGNKVEVKFSEPIRIDALRVALAKKFLDRAELKVNGIAYKVGDSTTVVLKTEYLEVATLYGAIIEGAVDFAQNTMIKNEALVFVGNINPSTAFTFASQAVIVTSNTQIRVCFERQLDKAAAENIENYAITKISGGEILAISKAVLQPNERDVELTVATLSDVGYELIVTNLMDIYNNPIRTIYNGNRTMFTGRVVADRIKYITSIDRKNAAITNQYTQICVTFNEAVGPSATDENHYFIDGEVGVPTNAEIVPGSPEKVILTIGNTVAGKIYTLRVTNLENSDGVRMDFEGVKGIFAGIDNIADLPKIEKVVAADDHTIKVHFDRAVTIPSINGRIYSGNTLAAGVLSYKVEGGTYKDLASLIPYVSVESFDSKVLVIRGNAASFEQSPTENGSCYLRVDNSTFLNTTPAEFVFEGNAANPVQPKVQSVIVKDKNTLVVYFDSDIADLSGTPFTIAEHADGAGTKVEVISYTKLSSKSYRIKTADMTNMPYYLILSSSDSGDVDTLLNNVTDLSTYVCMEAGVASTTSADYLAVPFTGTANIAKITSVFPIPIDDRTISIIFPEPMTYGDPTSVKDASNPDNYRIYTDGMILTYAQPVAALYDAETKTVILYLNSELTGSLSPLYNVGVKSTIENFAGTTTIDGSLTLSYLGNGIKCPFAALGLAPGKPTITSVTPSADNTRLTVKFDRAVAFGNPDSTEYITGTNNVLNHQFGVQTPGTLTYDTNLDFAAYFEMTGTDVDGGAVTAPITAIRKNNFTVELVFTKAFKANTIGTIKVKDYQHATNTIFTMSKTRVASTDNFPIIFFIPSTAIEPTPPPVVPPTPGVPGP